jgi:hypothetical protein
MKDYAGDGVGGFAGSLLQTPVKGELSNSSNPASRYCLLKDRATRVDLNGGILELKGGAALGRKLCVWSVPFGREGRGRGRGLGGDSRCCRREDIFQGVSGRGLAPGVQEDWLSRRVFLRWNRWVNNDGGGLYWSHRCVERKHGARALIGWGARLRVIN